MPKNPRTVCANLKWERAKKNRGTEPAFKPKKRRAKSWTPGHAGPVRQVPPSEIQAIVGDDTPLSKSLIERIQRNASPRKIDSPEAEKRDGEK
jgi:hypothetical protein